MSNDSGYVNYFEVLGLPVEAKPGEVRKEYRRRMKDLVMEIARVEITEDRRSRYLLDMAKLNAALLVLRESSTREAYWTERQELIALEEKWTQAAEECSSQIDALRRQFDAKFRHFLARYVEELMLDAGRDKECVEASNWDAAHERHAYRILRHYRQSLYQEVLERLPYSEITKPSIDWAERSQTIARILAGA